jgi:hypothetical protein
MLERVMPAPVRLRHCLGTQKLPQRREQTTPHNLRLLLCRCAIFSLCVPIFSGITGSMAQQSEQWKRMLRGELYHSFAPEFVEARTRCEYACDRYNNAGDVSRRKRIELWRE